MCRAQLSAGCVESPLVRQRENRYVNSPFHPTCKLRNGTGAAEDDCIFDQTCPSCSYPVNHSSVLNDVSAIKNAHSGTSGFSAVYDTMCGLTQLSFVSDLITAVRDERAIKAVALTESAALSKVMLTQCNSKRASGDFANGVIKLKVPTAVSSPPAYALILASQEIPLGALNLTMGHATADHDKLAKEAAWARPGGGAVPVRLQRSTGDGNILDLLLLNRAASCTCPPQSNRQQQAT